MDKKHNIYSMATLYGQETQHIPHGTLFGQETQHMQHGNTTWTNTGT